jgi:hypothetical protein
MEGGRQLGSAAFGGALAGPVGGLIGATRRHPDQITVSYVRDEPARREQPGGGGVRPGLWPV